MAHRTHRHPGKAIDPLIRMALRDMTPSNAQAAECLFQEAKAIYREACAFLDRTVEHAAQRLPQLEEHRRGAETIHRYPEKNLDVMLALMLIKLRGNVKAGEILIESGSFLEWEMVQRTAQNTMEDVWFLLSGEGRDTKIRRRFMASFFDEDWDKDGNFTKRPANIVTRKEIRDTLRLAVPTQTMDVIVEMSRRLQRVWSGSVHGRASSIIQAYFEELTEIRPWVGGARERSRVFFVRPSLYLMTALVLSTVAFAGIGRWWDDDRAIGALELAKRLIDAIDAG